MLVFRLALRALAWRAAASATVFAVALIGVVAAAVGPIYLHAVDETVLAERLTDAPQSQRDVHVSRLTLVGATGVNWIGPVRDLARQGADPRWFDAPVFSEEAQVYLDLAHQRLASQLAAIDGLCRHVRVVSGHCVSDTALDDAMISARTARAMHLHVGDVLTPLPIANVKKLRFTIVGIATPIAPHGAYWQPWNYFNAASAIFDNQLPRLDSVFVSHTALLTRVVDVAQTVGANVHLRPQDVHVDDIPALRGSVQQLEVAAGAAQHTSGLSDINVGSELATVLDGMNREMSLARTLIILPTVQLVLLAIFVLYAVVAGTTSVQGSEVALAKLRGRRPRSVLLQGVLQPVLLILVAAPVASLVAWLIVRLVADNLLGRHVTVTFPTSALGVVAAAAGGGIIAAVVAARRIVVSPVGALLRKGTDQSGSSVGLALADSAAVALALAGLVELIAGGVLDSGSTDPLSALAPTLLGVAAAIIVLRLLPFAGRVLVRWTRDSRRLASFLAVRQIVRRPAGARVLVLVGVALALATFAVTNWSVARTNREARALNQTGASTVLDVAIAPRVHDLRQAVDKADPDGHSMAAAFVQASRSTPLLAVDTARFSGVAEWQSSYSVTPLRTILKSLAAPQSPSMAFTGDRIALDVNLTAAPPGPVGLVIYVTGADHRRSAYDFGKIARGQHHYTALLAPICSVGCRVTGLNLSPITVPNAGFQQVTHPIRATIAAQAVTTGQAKSIAGFAEAARWRDDGVANVELRDGSSALRLNLEQSSTDGPWPQLLSADIPSHLPAVLASGTAGSYPGESAHDAASFGLDDNSQPIDGLFQSVTLPQLDRYGVLVDIGLAQQAMADQAGQQTQYQVWLSPSAPRDMTARLAKQGVVVTGVVHASKYRALLDHTGPAFADGLFLVAAAAAALLAVGATVLGGVTTARRRAYELAALQAAGVAPRVLRRATALEQGLLLGIGLVVGVGAGLGGSVLALPSTPFFVDDSVGPPSQHGLPITLLAVLVGCLAVVFVLTCWFVARVVSRQASAARLREAQQ